MRIALTTVQVPFVRGGAEGLADGLKAACLAAGHEVDVLSMPFLREPPEEMARQVEAWASMRYDRLWVKPDKVIALKYPAYLAPHPDTAVWLLHQPREYYDLTDAARLAADPAYAAIVERVRRTDRDALAPVSAARRLHTIAANVTRRLRQDTGLESVALYHPPPGHEAIYGSDDFQPVIFAPSRLESLKRQHLLIEAMALVRSPVAAVIAGGGTMHDEYARRIADLGLGSRVRLLGPIAREEMLAWYAHSLSVFFGPRDEDYGYVTLEAMLARRPVITCADSGGPLEFVVDGETGSVCEPAPEAIARAIDRLHADPRRARAQGEAGFERYRAMDISWRHVLEALLA